MPLRTESGTPARHSDVRLIILAHVGRRNDGSFGALRPRVKPHAPGRPRARLRHPMGDGKCFGQIQSIYNGDPAPITRQRLAGATEKPRAQEQWKTMERTMR